MSVSVMPVCNTCMHVSDLFKRMSYVPYENTTCLTKRCCCMVLQLQNLG